MAARRPITLLLALLVVAVPALAEDAPAVVQKGTASFYDEKFEGKPTASGEPFRPDALTAASPDLPLGTKATVTNEKTGKSVDVHINDRGPYVDGRIIDLSKRAAEHLDMKKDGVAPVRVEARPEEQPTSTLAKKVEEKAKSEKAE